MSTGSETDARSTNRTPSVYFSKAFVATWTAIRVFPTPPTPVRVTSRDTRSRRAMSAIFCPPPINLVSWGGRLCSRCPRMSSIRMPSRPHVRANCHEFMRGSGKCQMRQCGATRTYYTLGPLAGCCLRHEGACPPGHTPGGNRIPSRSPLPRVVAVRRDAPDRRILGVMRQPAAWPLAFRVSPLWPYLAMPRAPRVTKAPSRVCWRWTAPVSRRDMIVRAPLGDSVASWRCHCECYSPLL